MSTTGVSGCVWGVFLTLFSRELCRQACAVVRILKIIFLKVSFKILFQTLKSSVPPRLPLLLLLPRPQLTGTPVFFGELPSGKSVLKDEGSRIMGGFCLEAEDR